MSDLRRELWTYFEDCLKLKYVHLKVLHQSLCWIAMSKAKRPPCVEIVCNYSISLIILIAAVFVCRKMRQSLFSATLSIFDATNGGARQA